MYRDGNLGASSKSQNTPCEGQSEDPKGDAPAVPKGKYETVLYRDVRNVIPRSDIISNVADSSMSTTRTWAPNSDASAGAIMPIDGFRDPLARSLTPSMYYGNHQFYSSLPSQSSTATGPSDQNNIGGPQDISGASTVGMDAINDVGDYNNVYDVMPQRLDRSVTVNELVRLNDAITELTKRMPLPPTQELLNAIEPHLSMTLQLTYLRAYIQNQQLLIDARNRIFGGVLNNYDFRSAMRPPVPTLCASSGMDTTSYTESFYGGSDGSSMAVDVSDVNWGQSPAIEYSMGGGAPATTQPYDSANQGESYGDGVPMQYPPYVDVGDTLNQQQFKTIPNLEAGAVVPDPHTMLPAMLPSIPLDVSQSTSPPVSVDTTPRSMALATVPKNTQTVQSAQHDTQESQFTEVQTVKNPVPTIPPEFKSMVKYDGQKHSFVSVYLGPLGARRRRLFSIRKFGVDGALKLAADFAVGSTSAAVPSKERRLLEEVCTVALRCNPESGTKIDHVEAARSMPETRGLVFSCGAQLWMIITYNSSTGERDIEAFNVETLGFHGAYKAAVSALEKRLQNGENMTSKLSGPLYFWLESGGRTLCLMVTSRDLLRPGPSDQELYIGRFDVASSGGFNGARRLAQKWRSELRNQLIH
ncbi:uncharacterized protein BXIN_0304 [Babesia sp. Xinjiang]|uniref:uncharacterized protein n=1 Tax=Babesia sp. Xinjiang TaxID=462227 RepID=UPI000A21AEFD|nr:uncharacterized protein BXIN_0303 [Babesia sp. Xinjiang]XP_028871621.1 uncharacterized protein BXIN_0304 [Babesia sp. Xinjiang]ORM41164.1 hypothetical protein BXIN_0303 [Babesia sp. Xinjiang]ORM41165.1 hypothetical protein BXIN_0304 [Babesia sp. Xinjiang]